MRNLIIGFKRFLANKNTVTILGIVVAVLVLYVGYNSRINAATNPQKVPYAKVTIQPKTEITADMISYMYVPKSSIQGNVLTSSAQIIKKYSNYNTVIPEGSLFYEETVVNFAELPDASFSDIQDGYTVYNFPVNMYTTYGNSLFPDNYIDIYFKGVNDSGEVMFGQLYKDIKILAVKDSKGESVFKSSAELGTPSMLLFAVPNDMYLVLKKAAYLTTIDADLVVVPVTEDVTTTPGITSSYLVDFINAKTSTVPQDQIDSVYEDNANPEQEESETPENE